MPATLITQAVGFYSGVTQPLLTTEVTALIAQGYSPVGAPTLTDTFGQASQLMAKVTGVQTTAYTLTLGSSPNGVAPFLAVPPAGSWDALGNALWVDSKYYLLAWTQGPQVSGLVSLSSGVTGILPIANGGTGATTAGTAWTNLGGGSIGKLNSVDLTTNVTGILPVANGGTGASDAAQAWTNLGGKAAGKYDVVPVANGGTGGNVPTVARTNLGLDRLVQQPTQTLLYSPNTNDLYFFVDVSGDWGCYSVANGPRPLGITRGGTGATNVPAARNNLTLGDTQDVRFRTVYGNGGGFNPVIIKEASKAVPDANAVNYLSSAANPGFTVVNYVITIPNDSHQYVWQMQTNVPNIVTYFSMRSDNGFYTPEGRCAIQGSDVRIKHGFTPAKSGARERINKIGIMEFYYNNNPAPMRGYLAQQMGEIDDMYVFEGGVAVADDGTEFEILNVNDKAVMADMITLIQELTADVTALKAEVESLKAK